MKIIYDEEADAIYIHIMPEDTKSISTQGDWPFHVDLDKEGKVIGIEIMDASKVLDSEYLKRNAERIG